MKNELGTAQMAVLLDMFETEPSVNMAVASYATANQISELLYKGMKVPSNKSKAKLFFGLLANYDADGGLFDRVCQTLELDESDYAEALCYYAEALVE